MRRAALWVLLGLLSAPALAIAQTGGGGSSGGGSVDGAGGTGSGGTGSGGTGGSSAGSSGDGASGSTGSSGATGATGSSGSGSSGSTTVQTPDVLPTASDADVRRAQPAEPERPATPIFEIHGYLRARMELFSEFALGWDAFPTMSGGPRVPSAEGIYLGANLPWYRNPDWFANWCGITDDGTNPITPNPGRCQGGLQTQANMRLRLNPEIHPTENIAIFSQIDIFDNMLLGSTPEGYYGVLSGGSSGSVATARSPWAPITAFSSTQIPPVSGFNGFTDSIMVKRAWAEVTNNSLGQIRFGRMPSHWGLGILANAGNGQDSDYQSTNDRIMYAARLRSLGIFLAAMWDFPSIGASSATRIMNEPGQGQPVDLSTNDDVHQWVVALGRRMDVDAMRTAMARGEWVVNGGFYGVYRTQFMSGEQNPQLAVNGAGTTGAPNYGNSLVWRNAQAFIGDLWLQILRSNFRFEMEAAYIRGSVPNADIGSVQTDRFIVSQFGMAMEAELRLLNNRLHIEMRGGYASGDPDIEGLNYFNGLRGQMRNDRFLSLFRFHPDYRIDLIFWRQIMRQFAGAYYFRPSVQYNFIQEPNGDLLYVRGDVVYSRASEFIQTRGNDANLGLELNATIGYQSNHHRRDGTPEARPAPGFYAMIQYGIFFPFGGLGPSVSERAVPPYQFFASQNAQTVRGYVGVMF